MTLAPSVCLVAVSLLLAATAVHAEQPSRPAQQFAIDFTIGGVGVGSTLDELLERLPAAVAGSSPSATPMRHDHFVVINNGANQVPTAYFRFVDKSVISIEIHYSVMSVNEIQASTPMVDQFANRFGDYERTWRDDRLDGGVDIYVWKSKTRFVSFAMHDDGTAKLYIASADHPQLYPPKTPKTSLLGIDPAAKSTSGG